MPKIFGTVSGVASTTAVDANNERIGDGVFDGALNKKYPLLYEHDTTHPASVVGLVTALDYDGSVLRFTAEVWDARIHNLLASEALRGVSVGFTFSHISEQGTYDSDVELAEISLTFTPANPECLVTSYTPNTDFVINPTNPIGKEIIMENITTLDDARKAKDAILAELEDESSLTPERVAELEKILSDIEAVEAELQKKEEDAKAVADALEALRERAKKSNVNKVTKSAKASAGIALAVKAREVAHTSNATVSVKAGEILTQAGGEGAHNIVTPATGARDLLDVVNVISTSARSVPSVLWTPTNADSAPAFIGDGATKPQLEYVPEVQEYPLRKVAVTSVVSDTVLEDDEDFFTRLERALYRRLRKTIVDGIVAGDGAGNNLRGIASVSGVNSVTRTSDLANDVLNAVATIEDVTGITPDTLVLSKADFLALTSAQNSSQGYIFVNPATGARITPWGIQNVFMSTKVTNPILGAFGSAEAGYLREHVNGATLEWSNSDKDNFSRDLSTVRAYDRVAWITELPEAFAVIEA